MYSYFLHVLLLKWNCLLCYFFRRVNTILFQIIMKGSCIYIFMFKNMSSNFSLFAFIIMAALYFRYIFLKFRTIWSSSYLSIFIIIWSIFIVISNFSNAGIWILELHILIILICIIIKAFFRWIIVFFNCNLALMHRLEIWCAYMLFLEQRLLLVCSIN